MTNQKSKQHGKTIIGAPGMPTPISAAPPFVLRHPLLWLCVAVAVVYLPTISYGLTDLDDGIFIKDYKDFNEHIANLFSAFSRSVFNTARDIYYRPVFLDTMLLNYQIADHGQSIASYHVINILLHMTAVILLYRLLIKCGIYQLYSFLLSLLFAVHPVFAEAVAWIPGRIEIMLAIFVFSFFINNINYAESGKIKYLLLSVLFLLLAFFTKETTIAALPAAFVIQMVMLKQDWRSRNNKVLFAAWMGCVIVWYAARTLAHIPSADLSATAMVTELGGHLPILIQYAGKLFLPFNLSVYPLQRDTTYVYGIIAIVVVAVLLFISHKKGSKLAVLFSGIGIFLLFVLPSLFVPAAISEQVYEYRLYIPALGILLVLSQVSILPNKFKDKYLLTGGVVIAVALSVINYNYQRSFADARSFWSQAVESAPHSSYAHMMLSARTGDEAKSKALFIKAFELNPRERYVNFIYGVMLQEKDSVLQSEKYFLKEKEITGKPECDLYLARVEIKKEHFQNAIKYLETFLPHDPSNTIGNNTLVLLYIETDQYDKARARAKLMQEKEYEISEKTMQELRSRKLI